jgi:superfamily II DNA or RNA helicase
MPSFNLQPRAGFYQIPSLQTHSAGPQVIVDRTGTPLTIEYNGAFGCAIGLHQDDLEFFYIQLSCLQESKLNAAQHQKYITQSVNPEDYQIRLFDQSRKLFPVGLLALAVRLAKKLGYSVTTKFIGTPLVPAVVDLPEYLRGYQVDAIKIMLAEKIGICQMSTGAGKTLSAAAFLLHFPQARVLFTVPSTKLAAQTRKEFASFFNEPIGLVGGGKYIWERITVGIIDSLAIAAANNRSELSQVQIVFHDECHSCGSKSYLNTAQTLTSAEYIVGLSATPKRNDGCGLVMNAVCGEVNYIVKDEEVAAYGGINLPTYIQVKITDRYKQEKRPYPNLTGYQTPADILKAYRYAISEYTHRNLVLTKIVDQLIKLPSRQGNILVLFDYIDHGQTLQQMLKRQGIGVPLIDGQVKKVAERKASQEMQAQFRANKFPVLLGSSVLRQGVDFPNLEFLVLAGASANDTNLFQGVGRAVRVNSDYKKVRSVVIDIGDSDPYFGKRAKKRIEHVINRYGRDCSYQVLQISEIIKVAESKLINV